MSTELETLETSVVPEEIPAPVIETPAVTAPVEEEKTHVYQPTDELGRALGGKQVIKYRTHDELVQKLTDQNILVVRKLREQTRKQRLGIVDAEQIPDDAPRFDSIVEFAPRELNAEECIQLSRDLLDPEKVNAAKNTLVEAALGATPVQVRKAITDVQTNQLKMQAQIESEAFVRETPGYYGCKDNFETITNWMLRNNLAPVRENFARAYNTLKNVLLEGPQEAPVPVTAPPPAPVEPPPPVEEPVIVPPVQPPVQAPEAQPVVRIGTGLTRNNAADVPNVPRSVESDIVYEHPLRDGRGNLTGKTVRYTGLSAIDKMPSDEFKRRANSDKTFNQKYEKLLEEQQQRSRR